MADNVLVVAVVYCMGDTIVLAGYKLKISEALRQINNRIVNVRQFSRM